MAATFFLPLLAVMKRHRARIVPCRYRRVPCVMFLSLSIIPAIFQSFVVQPNELSLEKPFLEKNIAFTRKAYQLGQGGGKGFLRGKQPLSRLPFPQSDILKNIRLWDHRPLLQAFKQTQGDAPLLSVSMRLMWTAYLFPAKGTGQVMVSPRELSEQVLQQARTWG